MARLLCLASALALPAWREAGAQADPEGRFSESLIVRERTFFVDESVLPAMESAFRRGPDDFLLLLDGSSTEVVASAPDDPPVVTHLVWLDFGLAATDALARGAKLLSVALDSFPDGGEFELVEADAESIRSESLSRAELATRLARIGSEATAEPATRPSLEERAAALDRLAAEIPKHRVGELGALWLVADPWIVQPETIQAILQAGSEAIVSNSPPGALLRAARVLASRGWVVFPVSAPRSEVPEPPRAQMDRPGDEQFFDRGTSPRFDGPNPGLLRWIFPWRRQFRTRLTPSQSLARTLELATEIRLAPMAELARETSGALAGDEVRIVELADRLAHRLRLVVLDSSPDTGGLRRIEVAWLSGDGRTVPAIPWFASLAPRELGISRLFHALRRGESPTGSPLRLRSVAGGGEELCFAYPRKRAALRLSAWSGVDERLESIFAAEPGNLEAECVPLPPDLLDDDFVQLEALDLPESGAARLSDLR